MPSLSIAARVVATVAVATSVACSGPAMEPLEPATNVVLIVVDTLRADRLGCYGHDQPTSPNIDRLAAAGVRFESAYSTAPWTLPSAASIVTGLYPASHGAHMRGAGLRDTAETMPSALSDRHTTLPEVLLEHGIRSGMIANNPYMGFGVEQGFDTARIIGGDADVQTRRALDWVREVPDDERFFLLLHYMDVHEKNRPPAKHRAHFPEIGDLTDDEAWVYGESTLYCPGDLQGEDFETFRRRRLATYDASIHFVDEQIGRFLDRLEEDRPDQSTALILVADHGEEFWEHASLAERLYGDLCYCPGCGHGLTLFEEAVAIPFVVSWPGMLPATVVDTPVSLVDVMPTVLELMQVPYEGVGQGRSLLDALRGLPLTPIPLMLDQTSRGENKTGILDGNLKWIRPESEQPLLIDLAADPEERNDASGSMEDERSRLDKLRVELLGQFRVLGAAIHAGQPPEQAALSPEQIERLKALGYVH